MRGILGQKDGMNKCTLDFLYNLFTTQEAYKKNKVLKSREERNTALEFAILRHALFPRNPKGVDVGLLQF